MELKKAFEMTVQYTGKVSPIKVDNSGMICLNDMVLFFPNKNVKDWLRAKSTKEFIIVMENFLNGADLPLLNIDEFGTRGGVPSGLNAIKTKRGKYEGGTYATELLAMEFAMWLSPEFKLNVIKAYQDGTQRKNDWNIKRILSTFNYKLMTNAIHKDHKDPKFYHYTNEAIMINKIVFGMHEKGLRSKATESDLDSIAALEGHNSTLIALGMPFKERQTTLEGFARVGGKETFEKSPSKSGDCPP